MLQDLRYAVRMLVKNPAFTAAAVLTLALGIGANAAIFTVVDAVIFRPLPFADPESLVSVYQVHPSGRYFMPRLAQDAVNEWRNQTELFTHVEMLVQSNYASASGDTPQRLTAARVSTGMFAMLSIAPQMGRTFTPEEVEADARVVVLSHALWKGLYAGSPHAVGQKINLDEHDYEIIGVMPERFKFPYAVTQLWTPLHAPPGRPFTAEVVARLRPGVNVPLAQERADTISQALDAEKPVPNGWKVRLSGLQERRVSAGPRTALLLMLGAVGFVLLIACANAANLMLGRALAREREIAVRAALGAGRGRLVRQFVCESLVLALAGGSLGALLALWTTEIIVRIAPQGLTFLSLNKIEMDWRVLAFTFAVSLLTGLVFGVAPALRATRLNLSEALKAASRTSSGPGRHNLFRNSLVVVQMALSMVLLVGAGLLVHSFLRLHAIDPGFDTRNLVTMDLSLPNWKYPHEPVRQQFYADLAERVSALPGVEGATLANGAPPTAGAFAFGLNLETDDGPVETDSSELLPFNAVTADYFRILRMPLLRGRLFSAEDTPHSERVLIINDVMARRLWPGREAVGQRVRLFKNEEWHRVVGVVGNVYQLRVEDRPGALMDAYYASTQRPGGGGQQTLIVRTSGNAEKLIPALRTQVWSVDPEQPITQVRTVEQTYAAIFFGQQRFYLALMSAFAAIALLLAAVGIYGVVSYSVTQRMQEFGIRMALGAEPRNVLGLVLRRGLLLIALGVMIGGAAAVGLSRYLASLLFDVRPTDALTYAAVAAVLALVALAACWIPARRATRVDPMVALRYE